MKAKDHMNALVIVLGTLSVAFLVSLILALPVMWLWNSTFPDLFGFKEISWWTSWKLTMIVSFLAPIRPSFSSNSK
jgi:hypothetical protein